MATGWKDFAPTGWGPFDEEHRELAEAFDRLLDAVNAGKTAEAIMAMDQLRQRAVAHFEHEERLMAEIGWSQLDRHREAHDLFLVDLQRRSSELRERGLTASFRHWTLRRVLEWFRLHIMTNDFGLGRFLAGEKDPAATGPGDPETPAD